jgi:hypothetical protein
MAFQEVNQQVKFVGSYVEKGTDKPRFEKGTAIAEGNFIGSYKNNYNEDKPHVMLEQTDGQRVVINSSGKLHYLFFSEQSQLEKGDYVQVVYEGMTKVEKGKMAGKMAHDFKVLKDDERAKKPTAEKYNNTTDVDTLDNFDPSEQ